MTELDIERFEADPDNVRIEYEATEKGAEILKKKIGCYICFLVGMRSNTYLSQYPYER